MALTVQPGIVIARLLAALMRRDDGFSPCLKHKVDKVLACIASVSNHIQTGKSFSHFNGFGAVVALTSSQANPQGIAQAIGRDMNLGAETAPTAPQCLVNLFAAFFEHLLHTDERGRWCYPTARFPYPGPEQNTQTSLARPLPHTSARTAYKGYSNFRMHLVTVAIVPRFSASTAPLRQSGGTFVLNLSRYPCRFGETPRFSAIVHQLVVSSCGYYATNVNAT